MIIPCFELGHISAKYKNRTIPTFQFAKTSVQTSNIYTNNTNIKTESKYQYYQNSNLESPPLLYGVEARV